MNSSSNAAHKPPDHARNPLEGTHSRSNVRNVSKVSSIVSVYTKLSSELIFQKKEKFQITPDRLQKYCMKYAKRQAPEVLS